MDVSYDMVPSLVGSIMHSCHHAHPWARIAFPTNSSALELGALGSSRVRINYSFIARNKSSKNPFFFTNFPIVIQKLIDINYIHI